MQSKESIKMSSFAEDVHIGLTSQPKSISSKYFYDETGSRIFQEIMAMPEYYLTDAEHNILCNQSEEITQALNFGNEFSIIELGAGDGKKTFELLSFLEDQKKDIYYRPVDISLESNNHLVRELGQALPNLHIQPLTGDYFHVLSELPKRKKPALFLFLGSNIGNYEMQDSIELMKKFSNYLQSGDKMLVGFDFKKSPKIIQQAYDDPHGITRRFNMNLLQRMNRELAMNFDPETFDFFPYYNPNNGEMRSCLVSLLPQKVVSEVLKREYYFEANELLHTELSKKYTRDEIEHIARSSDFKVVQNFTDEDNYFVDSLWQKK